MVGFSSLVESKLSLAEIDNDKDKNYIAELSRQMAHDDDKHKNKIFHQTLKKVEKVKQFLFGIMFKSTRLKL